MLGFCCFWRRDEAVLPQAFDFSWLFFSPLCCFLCFPQQIKYSPPGKNQRRLRGYPLLWTLSQTFSKIANNIVPKEDIKFVNIIHQTNYEKRHYQVTFGFLLQTKTDERTGRKSIFIFIQLLGQSSVPKHTNSFQHMQEYMYALYIKTNKNQIPLSSFSFQAVLFTWGWWWGRSSGEGCLTKWAADSVSSFACPQMASSPSCHLLSRDTASSSFAVLPQALGKSDIMVHLEVLIGTQDGHTVWTYVQKCELQGKNQWVEN